MAEVRRGSVALDGGGVAEYVVRPAREGRGPCALVIGGLGANVLAEPIYDQIEEALVSKGVAAVRSQWRGPRHTRTLTSDVEGAVAVVEHLTPEILSREAVALVGHSLGGVIASVLASALQIVGAVLYGAPARRWVEALQAGAQRQLPLAGLSAADVERELATAGRLYQLVLREGRSRADLRRLAPELLSSRAAGDLGDVDLHGAPLDYLRSIDAIDVRRAWQLGRGAVVAIQGEYDVVIGGRDHDEIASIVRRAGRPAESLSMARTDHYFAQHADLQASFAARGKGVVAKDAIDALASSVAGFFA